jgi:hypothetical protein
VAEHIAAGFQVEPQRNQLMMGGFFLGSASGLHATAFRVTQKDETKTIENPTMFWALIVSDRNSTEKRTPNIGVKQSKIADKLVGMYFMPFR